MPHDDEQMLPSRYGSFLVIEQRLLELRTDFKDLRVELKDALAVRDELLRADNATRDARFEAAVASLRAADAKVEAEVSALKNQQIALSANLKLAGAALSMAIAVGGLVLKAVGF
jgi:hypothetical protein